MLAGWTPAPQPLKSPITETARAFGAQTANRQPAPVRWHPSRRYSRACVPSRNRCWSTSPKADGGAGGAGGAGGGDDGGGVERVLPAVVVRPMVTAPLL